MGFTFSTLARNQLQAMQMAVFFILPSILLSGFMFPFAGMPGWARVFGEVLPLTHVLRIVRGILLKGNGLLDVLPHLYPLVALLRGGRHPGHSRLPADARLGVSESLRALRRSRHLAVPPLAPRLDRASSSSRGRVRSG